MEGNQTRQLKTLYINSFIHIYIYACVCVCGGFAGKNIYRWRIFHQTMFVYQKVHPSSYWWWWFHLTTIDQHVSDWEMPKFNDIQWMLSIAILFLGVQTPSDGRFFGGFTTALSMHRGDRGKRNILLGTGYSKYVVLLFLFSVHQ